MSDQITEVTSEGCGGRLIGSIQGIVIGFIGILIAVVLLFWNEGRAVQTYRSLKEGAGSVVPANATEVNPANEGKLVHMTGQATTNETLTDSTFGVAASNVIKLVRKVQMHQWVEHQQTETVKKVGGGTETRTTYTYSKEWSSTAHDSGSFKEPSGHQNPLMEYKDETQMANAVTMGAFTLSPGLVGSISGGESLAVTAPPTLPGRNVTLENGGLYIGSGSPQTPQVGDYRVTFEVVRPATVSVIAQQVGTSFRPYQTKAGDPLEMLKMGAVGADQMFEEAQQSNTVLTWILRVVGLIIMVVSVGALFKPIEVLADVIPFLGDLVGLGLGLVSFAIGLTLSLMVIAVGWIFARPILGIVLLVVALAIAGAAVFFGMQMRKGREAGSSQPAG
ncbi:MAG: hypothetical protein HC884_07905 [Chloroflexaceae bacterium]|nr:hypothetical protein [Chloroflexaceae bacterium]